MPIIGGRQIGVRGLGFQGAGKPNQVTGLTSTDFGTSRAFNDGRIDLSWDTPANNGAPITGYRIERSTDNISYSAISVNTASTSTTYTDTGLNSNQVYYYKVGAINAVDTGDLSTAANATATTVPQAPTVTAANVGTGRAYNNGAATVTVTGGATGGKAISSYAATSSPSSFTASGSSPLTVTGLASATAYTFSVTATNANGTSTATTSGSITATTVPQAPTIGTAADGGTGTTATVTYTANATGGAAVSTFTATSSPSGFTGTGASPITVSGLTTGTAYTFTVTATNANGTSAASSASNSVTPAVPAYYLMGGDNGGLSYSTDLSSWTNTTFTTNTWFGGAYGNGLYVIAGSGGLINTATSPTTGVWTQRYNSGSNFLDMRYFNGNFIAVGLNKQILTSTDGISWTTRSSNFTNNIAIRGVDYRSDNGRYSVVAQWDSSKGANYSHSTNLSSWTAINIWTSGTSFTDIDGNNNITAVVDISSSDIIKSSDGVSSWSGSSVNNTNGIGIAWGNGTWVVAGGSGSTSWSTSATAAGGTFTQNVVGSQTHNYVVFVNGVFIMGGVSTPSFYTSTNGQTWTTRTALGTNQDGRFATYG
jgi:hypothetical protein